MGLRALTAPPPARTTSRACWVQVVWVAVATLSNPAVLALIASPPRFFGMWVFISIINVKIVVDHTAAGDDALVDVSPQLARLQLEVFEDLCAVVTW